jgi:hypothetical protein
MTGPREFRRFAAAEDAARSPETKFKREQTMKKIIGIEEGANHMRENGPRYYHDRLPETFAKRAARVYARLKGLDDQTSEAQWIDEFRLEPDYEGALAIYVQCLAVISKFQRRYGQLCEAHARNLYRLALMRSGCEDPAEAFRLVERHWGIEFYENEKRILMHLIDSCVEYGPVTQVLEARWMFSSSCSSRN